MKGKLIKVQLADGSQVVVKVLYVNGSTITVKSSDGLVYDVYGDTDSSGVYLAV